ncbi:MAG: metallophosphoesterase family protein [Planctomycetota bacterium]|nr:MAG: metallophosphoesterase family protein [Planctomycetota bacterium]
MLVSGLTLAVGLPRQHAEAHDGDHPPPAAKPAEVYQPSVLPDRVILTVLEDPRTSVAVTWRTSALVHQGWAEIVVADHGPRFESRARRLPAKTTALQTDINTAHFHSVRFEGLQPATTYTYRVGDGVNWSEWLQFRTAAAEPEPFSFVYFGDAQNSVRSLWSRVIREAFRDAPRAAFLLHAGDLINRAESDAEWGEWFGAGGWMNGMIPTVAVPGNHEQARLPGGARGLSRHWRPQFEFPLNGPPGLEETCYTFTYHNLRVVALDSNRDLQRQAVWLDQVLADNECEWVVCTFHHPIFSTSKLRDNRELRNLWKPVFDRYRVDLVLQGHDHAYGRSGLQVPDQAEVAGPAGDEQQNVAEGAQVLDPHTGTVYVVSVSGPKMYPNRRPPFMRRVGEDTQLYQIIHIDGHRLRFEARTAAGALYDAFELTKRPGQVNALREIEPEIPERLREPIESASVREPATP